MSVSQRCQVILPYRQLVICLVSCNTDWCQRQLLHTNASWKQTLSTAQNTAPLAPSWTSCALWSGGETCPHAYDDCQSRGTSFSRVDAVSMKYQACHLRFIDWKQASEKAWLILYTIRASMCIPFIANASPKRQHKGTYIECCLHLRTELLLKTTSSCWC